MNETYIDKFGTTLTLGQISSAAEQGDMPLEEYMKWAGITKKVQDSTTTDPVEESQDAMGSDLATGSSEQQEINIDRGIELDPEKAKEINPATGQPWEKPDRDLGDVISSYAANFAKMPISMVDNLVKGYETGEGGYVGEVLAENPFVATLGLSLIHI